MKQRKRKISVVNRVLMLSLPVAALVLFYTANSIRSTETDSDNDGMSDAYELFYGLNPTNSADADLNYDGDSLNNLQESALLTDPFASDSDRDGFNDAADSNAVSRAYIRFGDPKFTSGDQYSYAVPAWLLGVYRINGDWITNAPPAGEAAWHVSSSEGEGVGSLNVDLNRSVLTNDLVFKMRFFDHTNASLYMDLVDTNATVVVENLFGNIQTGSNVESVVYLSIPLETYSGAAVIHLRRGLGEVTVYESLLYVDKDGDGLDREQEAQLGTSDYSADSDGDGVSDYEEVFMYGTNPLNTDSDGDGMPDAWEISHGLNPLVNDSSSDLDNDGLTNLQEYQYGTDPNNADTDGDGMSDAGEILYGKDPLVYNAYAGVPFAEYFEADTVQVGLIHGQNGWEAFPTNGAFVQTNTVYAGAQAFAIFNTAGSDVRHLFGCSNQTVWVESAQRTDASSIPTGTIDLAAAWFFNDAGRLVVYDGLAGTGGDWTSLTNHTPFTTPQWVRVAAMLDYEARLWNVYLNGVLLASDLGFSGSAGKTFTALEMRGQYGFADNLRFSLTVLDNIDSDNDGMPDWWEISNDLNPLVNDAALDPDNDGLTNIQEYQYGTDPQNADTDGDEYSDGLELQWGTDPTLASSFPHGEISGALTYTGPQTGMIYVALSTNAGGDVLASQSFSQPGNYAFTNVPALKSYWIRAWRDSNGNFSNDFWEAQGDCVTNPVYLAGDVANANVALSDPDTDSDGLPDWWEMKWFYSLNYGANDDPDGDGITNIQEYLYGTDPTSSGSVPRRAISGTVTYAGPQTGTIYVAVSTNAGAGIVESQSLSQPGAFAFTNLPGLKTYWVKALRDSNGNVANDFWEAQGNYAANPVYLNDNVTDANIALADPDTDSDGLPDWWEMKWFSSLNYGPGDDPDGDGLTNLQEYQYGTNPNNADTDGDGISDGDEARYGENPAVSNVYASVPFVELFETNTVQVGPIHGQNGWKSWPTNGAFVQTNIVYAGAQALSLPNSSETSAQVMHMFVCSNQTVWVEMVQWKDVYEAPIGAVTSAAAWFFNDAGRLVVYDGLAGTGGDWVTLTNHTPFTMPQWVRVAAKLDYGTRRWNMYLNGALLATNLGFSALADEKFMAVEMQGKYGGVDNMLVSSTLPEDIDSDADGMPDWWEISNGLNINDPSDANLDPDNDLLINRLEYENGTDINDPDTDGDVLTDGYEVLISNTNPLDVDTDADGLNDWWEVRYGMNPLVSDNPAADPDSDGLANSAEETLNTNPLNVDSDSDGMPDGWENVHSLNPAAGCFTSLVSWWRFDEQSGRTAYDDNRVWSNNGQLMNGALNDVYGYTGNELKLDGIDAYVLVPDHYSLNSTNGLTVAMWVNVSAFDNTNQPAYFVSKGNSAGYEEYSVSYVKATQNLRFSHKNAGNQSETVSVTCPLSVGVWTHLAVTVSGSQVLFYLNGVQQGAAQTLAYERSNIGDLAIGSTLNPNAVNPFFHGSMDDVRLYNAVLSSAQIAAFLEGEADSDGDGLTNRQEYEYGTDPNADDRYLDSDGDGLSNYDEIMIYHTDPFNPDSDGDGVNDGDEVRNGTDPNKADYGMTGGDLNLMDLVPKNGSWVW